MLKTTAIALFGAAGLLAACESKSRENQYGSETERAGLYAEQSGARYSTVSSAMPEARILSMLHCKNLEEVELGRLAQEKGQADNVRQFGRELVKDHASNNAQLMTAAREAGVTIIPKDEIKRMMRDEKGESADYSREDLAAKLRNLSGSEFDRVFAERMQQGHREMIRKVEAAEPTIQDQGVREFLGTTLAVLREHERMASRLTSQLQGTD